MSIEAIDINKSYRLFNIGATTIVSAKHDGVANAMSAAWVMPLDYTQLLLVLGRDSYTRQLIEKEGYFAVQLPVVGQADLTMELGTESRNDTPEKMQGVPLFYMEGYDQPLIEGCAAWVICKLTGTAENREDYDLLMGQIIAGWSDTRIYSNNHWHLDEVPEALRTIHYVAGGKFYFVGGSCESERQLDVD